MFPCMNPEGKRATGRPKAPGVGAGFRAPTSENRKRTWYRRTSVISEGLREGHQAVLADHITDDRNSWPVEIAGNRCPRDPFKGRRGRA